MRLHNLLLGLTSALCLMICSRTALAVANVRIGVIPFAPLSGDVPQGAGVKGADVMLKELKNQNEFQVVARPPADGNAALAALTAARQKLAEGRTLASQRKGKAGVQAYRAAVDSFAKATAEIEVFDEVIDAHAELGALLYRVGKDDEGQKELFEALRLSAGRPLKLFAASPTYAAAAEDLAKKLAKLGKGSARVDSLPTGADVYVDGQPAGKTPVVLRDLPEGKHFVRALLPSGEKWGTAIDVAPKSDAKLRAQSGAEGPTADISAALAENNIQPAVLPSLRKVADSQRLAFVVFGALHRTPDGLALDPFLYSVERGKVARLKRVAFDTELLEAGLQMDKVVAEVQTRLAGEGGDLALAAKASPDVAAERELATEFHFGGVPDALPDTPAVTPPAGGTEDDNGGRRIIVKHPRD